MTDRQIYTPEPPRAPFFFELCRAEVDAEPDPDKQLELLAKLITDAELAKQAGSGPAQDEINRARRLWLAIYDEHCWRNA